MTHPLPLIGAVLLTLAVNRPALADPVVVAARPIARGAVLGPADVALAERAPAPPDALRSVADAAGQEALSAITAGAVVRHGALAAPVAARRGEAVTLRAAAGGMVVEMAGVAATDLRAGGRGVALNPATGRRVTGRVARDGAIEVQP
jgi:flagella basal body P-ring formation protein FlgA